MASSIAPAHAGVHSGRVREIEHRIADRPQGHPLVLAGQESRTPEAIVDGLGFLPTGPARGHDDECRQVWFMVPKP